MFCEQNFCSAKKFGSQNMEVVKICIFDCTQYKYGCGIWLFKRLFICGICK